NRLFEPGDSLRRELFGKAERLFAAVRTIRIDEETSFWTDCRTSASHTLDIFRRVGPNFDLYHSNASLDPSRQLRLKLIERVGSKAAAAVYRNGNACISEQ